MRWRLMSILLAIAETPLDTRNLVLPLLPLALEALHWLGWIKAYRNTPPSAGPLGEVESGPEVITFRPAERYRMTVVHVFVLAMWFFWLIIRIVH